MKFYGLYQKNNIQMPEQKVVRNNVSNSINGKIETAPTQTEPEDKQVNGSSAASDPINSAKQVEALKAQTLAQAPISYSFIRDIKLPFSNNAKLYKLANGQKVVVLEKKGPTVLETYYNVGSLNEPDDKRGISHFNEHMAFNGSKNPSGEGLKSGDFFKYVNEMGAMTNASTGFSQTNYYITSQLLGKGNDFETSAYLQSEQLQYPEHTESMVEKEKGPVTSEISMVGDQPENVALNQCVKNLYNIQTTSPDLVAGSIDNINKLTRKDTLGYYNLWYTPDNSATVITGEIPTDEAMNTVAKYFNKSAYVPVQNRKYQDLSAVTKPVRVDLKMPKAQTSVAAMGFSGPANNSTKENIELEVLMTSLMGYKNARISRALNKIQANAMMNIERVGNRPQDPKAILIASQSTPQKTEEVLKTVYAQINEISNKPLTQDELETSKNILKMTFSKISENSQMLNSLLGNAVMDDDIAYVENYLQILDKITPEDVSKLAKKYLDLNKVSLAVVHPQSLETNDIISNYNKANSANVNINTKNVQQHNSSKVAFKGRIEEKTIDLKKLKQYRLANNMELAFNPNNSDLASCQLDFKVSQPANVKPSVPAILSVMLNEGTKTKTNQQFYAPVHKAGMNLKFNADFRSMGATVECLPKDFDKSLDLIKEVFSQPRFNDKSLDYAKKLVKEAVMNMEDSASDNALKELFPNLPQFATKKEILDSLDTVTLPEIQGMYDYVMKNAMSSAVVTAPFEKDKSLEQTVINKLSVGFNTFKPYNHEHYHSFEPVKENKVIAQSEPRNQADIIQTFKFKTNYNPKDHVTFSLLNTILGGGPSSRLFEDLREKQKLAYRVESGIDYAGDTGVVSLAIKTTTDDAVANIKQYDNVQKSLDGFKTHIEKMKNEAVSEKELESAKLRMKTKILNSIESSSSQTGVLSNAKESVYGLSAVNENLKLIDEITPQDIQNAAKYIFADKSLTSVLASVDTIKNMNIKAEEISPKKD